MPVRVLLVDDSAVIRGLMAKALMADPQITVVDTAANGEMAIRMAREQQPDIVVLDIAMPVMDGLTALPGILQASPQSKVVIASTLTVENAAVSVQALELGAMECLAKPSSKNGGNADVFYRELIRTVQGLGGIPVLPPLDANSSPAMVAGQSLIDKTASEKKSSVKSIPEKPVSVTAVTSVPAMTIEKMPPFNIQAIAIASSTGGPQALLSLFSQIKGHLLGMPIFITQHMPPTFTTILADHIAKMAGRPCMEAREGEKLVPGYIYLAPGDYHLMPEKNAVGEVIIRINQLPPENYCRPAADPMLRSLSKIYGKHLLTIILTGMGQDGMEGAKEVVRHGGSVIAQDEASCVVYGMPKAVAEQHLCRAVLPLEEMGAYLLKLPAKGAL